MFINKNIDLIGLSGKLFNTIKEKSNSLTPSGKNYMLTLSLLNSPP